MDIFDYIVRLYNPRMRGKLEVAKPATAMLAYALRGPHIMKIHGDLASGNCLKIKYTADFLGIQYEWIPVDITTGETKTPAFNALNPMAQVPVVAFPDGRSLAQSNAIISFLAEGSSLLPPDAFGRAKVNECLFWEQYSHEPYIAVCRYHMYYAGKSKDTRESWRVDRGEQALDLMDRAFENRQWLAADHLTVADISLVAYTRLAAESGFNLCGRRHLTGWIERCENALSLESVHDLSRV